MSRAGKSFVPPHAPQQEPVDRGGSLRSEIERHGLATLAATHITAILKALKVANRTEAVIRVSGAAANLVSSASKRPASCDRHLNWDQKSNP
jgi:hypothetical protein